MDRGNFVARENGAGPVTAVDPGTARTAAEFVVLLGRRREVAGMSYRDLDRHARRGGGALPPSTVATVLRRPTLPGPELVAAYVRACGGDGAEVAEWLASRARIAASADAAVRAAVARSAHVVAAPVPRQLPPAPAGLVGRDAVVARLDAVTGGPGARLAVVTGPPGVGKTASAVHWAHRARARFPDGQFSVDLRGRGPGEALAHLLVGLGVPAAEVPADREQAAALFRSAVADRRVLLLVDGAVTADQVRPLRPGGPGSCTVVTSRDRLVDLVVHDGAEVVEVPPLGAVAAVRVLAACAGERVVEGEPAAARALAELCGGLPLALRIAGCALDRGARAPVADLVARMRAAGALAALDEAHGALSVAFREWCDALDEVCRGLVRVLGSLARDGVTAAVLAAEAGMTAAGANAALRRLVDAHLVVRDGGRYVVPRLVHEFARGLVEQPVVGIAEVA
ncbi:ATP-binding protein [Saccharothrix syringae]|uniref:ORC1/DEAH AAA+ ATPase domain-containing protein n=1 Tax=Saccharothrix syringae TaxID=103733 RepID=A0A5Q0H4H4_SACSY|nr:ATP-binding protein [Saccharothrix syringae]QFZ21126.1 hypothetical protein EKG83_30405 [Saccharothrix syringae]